MKQIGQKVKTDFGTLRVEDVRHTKKTGLQYLVKPWFRRARWINHTSVYDTNFF